MAGLGAGLCGGPLPYLTGARLARQQLRTLTWLRWRIFVNTLRGKGATGELIAKIISYPILGLMVIGPSLGCGFGAWIIIRQGNDQYLAFLLWGIFLLWQFVGVSTSTTGPSFDLSSLTRFPMRYRDYFLMRLTFGLLDPPNLMGSGCLAGMTVGIGIAEPALTPWVAVVALVYATGNVFFSRMVYSWLERWLAQRKTRELVTVVILLASLGFQVVAQSMHRLGRHGHIAQFSPQTQSILHALYVVNWFLPPGIASKSIEFLHAGTPLYALAALGALGAYAVFFLVILNRRLRAQFLGENLSEAPAQSTPVKRVRLVRTAAASDSGAAFTLFSPAVTAVLQKEFRYLIRSGPKLYSLILPVFMVFIFSSRNSGMAFIGVGHGSREAFVFTYGCLYLQLLLVAMVYNSLGADASGVQFYFMAPMRFRDVLLAKNLLAFGILIVEIVLIYVAAYTLAQPPTLDLAAATVAGTLFTFILGMSIGNVRSIVSPSVIDPTKMRRQAVSGFNGLISLLVTTACGALGALLLAGSKFFSGDYWLAALVLLVLAAAAGLAYFLVYQDLDRVAANNQETLTGKLAKA